MTVIIFIASIVALIIMYLIAAEFYKIAEDKGYHEKKYLWLSFFFGPVGYLLVVALPDRNEYYHKRIVKEISVMAPPAAPAKPNQRPAASSAPTFDDLPDL